MIRICDRSPATAVRATVVMAFRPASFWILAPRSGPQRLISFVKERGLLLGAALFIPRMVPGPPLPLAQVRLSGRDKALRVEQGHEASPQGRCFRGGRTPLWSSSSSFSHSQNNGGCSPYAVCKSTGDGQRTCSCDSTHTVGDGITCHGRVGLVMIFTPDPDSIVVTPHKTEQQS